ncbi:MAG: hypothetical protein RLZZ01_911, partial [Actinomycetota bacterium]
GTGTTGTGTTGAGRRLDRRTFRLLFVLLVLAGGMLRIGYVVIAKTDDPLVGDQIYYSAQAVSFANGSGFEHPYRAGEYAADHVPLTALAMVPVSWSDTNHIVPQRLAMAIYGTAVVAGLGVLARLLLGRRPALLAAGIAAVYANLWMNDGLVMAETLAAGTVVAALIATYRYRLAPTPVLAGLAGGAVGFAGLARAELLLLGPLVVAPMVLLVGRHRDRSAIGTVRHLVIAGAAAVLVISPWVVRNQVRFEESTWMSTQDGLTLLGANCPEAYAGDGLGFWILQCADRVDVPAGADQSEVSATYRRAAIDFIGDNLERLPVVTAARLGRGLSLWRVDGMVELNTGEGREPWASRIGLVQYWMLAPLAVAGFARWPSTRPRWPLLVTAGLSVALIAVAYGIPRFRIAAEVVIVIGAAAAIDSLLFRLRATTGTGPPVPPTIAT